MINMTKEKFEYLTSEYKFLSFVKSSNSKYDYILLPYMFLPHLLLGIVKMLALPFKLILNLVIELIISIPSEFKVKIWEKHFYNCVPHKIKILENKSII